MKGYGKLPTDHLTRSLSLSVSSYSTEVWLTVYDSQSEASLIEVVMSPDDCLELAEALKSAWVETND